VGLARVFALALRRCTPRDSAPWDPQMQLQAGSWGCRALPWVGSSPQRCAICRRDAAYACRAHASWPHARSGQHSFRHLSFLRKQREAWADLHRLLTLERPYVPFRKWPNTLSTC